MEIIKSPDGKEIAIIVKKGFNKDGINFISNADCPLQVGINNYGKGVKIKAHIHRSVEITIKKIQEVLYIKNGSLKVDLYSVNQEFLNSYNLAEGDLIFFLEGGHGFEILENTTIVEVKQGPYFGKSHDKTMIE